LVRGFIADCLHAKRWCSQTECENAGVQVPYLRGYMNLAEEYLKIAIKDLKATKILHKNRLYSQALFYFSQSVEKANKCFALTSNKYSEPDMLKINHDATRIYKDNVIELKRRYATLLRNLNQMPELKNTEFIKNLDIESKINECDESLRNLAEIQNWKIDLIYISRREIRKILKEISENDEEIKDAIKSVSNFTLTENEWEEHKKYLFKQLENPENNNNIASSLKKEIDGNKLNIKELETLIKKMYLQLLHCISISNYLYSLGIISLPHAIITRYPKDNLSPIKIYNKNLPIVKLLPDLIDQHSNALKILSKYYDEYYLNPIQ